MPVVTPVIETLGTIVDVAGVLLIVLGILIATGRYLLNLHSAGNSPYRQYRQDIGRGILIGLEVLVAADIIRTVALTPTLESVLVLGAIVLIRTFLSISMEMELEGRWPWQRAGAQNGGERL